MKSRRSFLHSIGKGAALSALGLSLSPRAFSHTISGDEQKPIKIGIIGAENSHTRDFGKLFNINKKFPGVTVEYVWGETEAFARDAMEKGQIPNMVKDPLDMLGKIDALIVDHRHAKYHLEAATPFIEAGIPTFIDKPFCYRLEEGKKFLALAREKNTPVTSYSSIAHSNDTFNLIEQVREMGEIRQVIAYGPVELDSEYGGLFFYGVHLVQPLLYIFGDDVKKVRITKSNDKCNASLVFGNGMLASLIFTSKKSRWKTFVESDQGMVELKPEAKSEYPDKNYVDMVHMFRTGEEPRSHQSILHCVAVLEALEKSASSEQWEKVMS